MTKSKLAQQDTGVCGKVSRCQLAGCDTGIAMCHFEVGIREVNQRGGWQIKQAPQQKVFRICCELDRRILSVNEPILVK